MSTYAKVIHHEESGKSLLVVDVTDEAMLQEMWHRMNISTSDIRKLASKVFKEDLTIAGDSSFNVWEALDNEAIDKGIKDE